ncbi:hypothetical protein LINGRAHAP2_LOCUS7668 [Linum grandiflorum]
MVVKELGEDATVESESRKGRDKELSNLIQQGDPVLEGRRSSANCRFPASTHIRKAPLKMERSYNGNLSFSLWDGRGNLLSYFRTFRGE